MHFQNFKYLVLADIPYILLRRGHEDVIVLFVFSLWATLNIDKTQLCRIIFLCFHLNLKQSFFSMCLSNI